MTFKVFYRPFGPKGRVSNMIITDVESSDQSERVVKAVYPKAVIVGIFEVKQ